MMRFIHVAVAVLSLLAVGQSAPVTSCDSLIQTLEISGREQLLGKWFQVAESTNNRDAELIAKSLRESLWIKISAANGNDDIALMFTAKASSLCLTTTNKATLKNNTIQPAIANETLKHLLPPVPLPTISLLKTGCTECLVLHSQYQMFRSTIGVLQLLSKRRTVTAAEMEEFKKQAECLNLPQPFSLNPDAGVCSEPPSQDTEMNVHMPRVFLDGQTSEIQNKTKTF
uniref:uncharacterized protein LOC124071551 n=1 Tax=Scatophagus argus TaxID=75038 RepID=UPI001ED8043D|nr:uncharacterized protein LOC124071551 [Scatophagus argus]